jgi:hypothetical protein
MATFAANFLSAAEVFGWLMITLDLPLWAGLGNPTEWLEKQIALVRDRILLPVTLTLGEFKTIIKRIISPATRNVTRASIKTQREQLTNYFRGEMENMVGLVDLESCPYF